MYGILAERIGFLHLVYKAAVLAMIMRALPTPIVDYRLQSRLIGAFGYRRSSTVRRSIQQ
jgi:hypothetical protein